MPPAATTGIGATASTTAGTSPIVPRVTPEWPPASRPCAMMISAPAAAASFACASLHLADDLAAGVLDAAGERRWITERQHRCRRPGVERDVERRRIRR
jgi:hypothetical protein